MINCVFKGSFGDRILDEDDWKSLKDLSDEKKKGKFKRWFSSIGLDFIHVEKVEVIKDIYCRYQFIVILHSESTVYQLAYRFAKKDIRTVDVFTSTIDEDVKNNRKLIDIPGMVFISTLLFLSYLLDPYS